MSRQLLCVTCASEFHLHSEDAANGMKMRKVHIKEAKRPEKLEVRIQAGEEEHVIPVPILVCDHCNDEIPEGTPAVAVTIWEASGEPEDWEKEYSR